MMLATALPKSTKVTVWVFPGQGSQKLGMGLDLLKHPLAQRSFSKSLGGLAES
ncbi:hypothetical protein [Crocosphaera sp. Alani8]|uniref:hypothetical protein n=1 Tax=Crocosphaera sp. Alani8 TaxID=3038952 RepID=UPI00313B53FD